MTTHEEMTQEESDILSDTDRVRLVAACRWTARKPSDVGAELGITAAVEDDDLDGYLVRCESCEEWVDSVDGDIMCSECALEAASWSYDDLHPQAN